jgi:uncharacterized protein YcfJ
MNRTLKIAFATILAGVTLAATADAGFARSRSSYCRAYARSVARHAGGDSAAAGMFLGAAAGGAYGAATGGGAASNILTGVALGGIGGTLLGAAASSDSRQNAYEEAFADCMGY